MKILLCLSNLAENFNIVSNDHGRTHKCDFSVFFQKFSFWTNLDKNKNCQFKLKFGTCTNLNMQNSMFTFSVFAWNCPFWAKLGPKNQTCQFMLKFGT